MAISTNHMANIWVYVFENTDSCYIKNSHTYEWFGEDYILKNKHSFHLQFNSISCHETIYKLPRAYVVGGGGGHFGPVFVLQIHLNICQNPPQYVPL